MNVLIVEDDKMLLKALTTILSREGNKIYAAQNGSEAVDIMSDYAIDLIICDLMMPTLSGVTFLSLLKGYFNRGTAVIVMSSLHNAEQVLKQCEIDYIAFFQKPFDMEKLINRVNDCKVF
jgi:DNA-binding response OmpR family regulator